MFVKNKTITTICEERGLKMSIIGSNYPIHDAIGKATGETIYTGDMKLKGMLHAAVVFSTIPHGKVKSIDDSKALAVSGVVKVLHCFNTSENKYNRYRREAGQDVPDQERVFNDHVRFVGDKVAAVVAETEQIARKAAKLIEVTYEELPYTLDVEETLSGKIDGIHPEGTVFKYDYQIGKDEELEEADIEITTTTNFPSIDHLPMETHAVVASYERSLNQLTIWSPCQSVHGIRTVVADLMEMPYNKVRVIKATMGGSFGGKQEVLLEGIAALCSQATGKPVRLVFNREEDFISTISRGAIASTMTSKFTKDGKLIALMPNVTLNAGAYLSNSLAYVTVMGGKLFRTYSYPYAKFESQAVITNRPVSGGYRGWSAPEITIIVEHNLNEAAKKLGIDPLELRLMNAAKTDEIDKYNDISLGEIRLVECLERGRDNFYWNKRKEEIEVFNKENLRYKRGLGVACGGHVSGFYPKKQDFSMAELKMAEDGTVIIKATLHDHGCGTVRAMQMIAAEVLGIAVDDVRASEGDTHNSPYEAGCYSSKTTYVLGRAVHDAAIKLKEEMAKAAAELHGVEVSDIEVANGKVTSKVDESINYTYGEIAVKSLRTLEKEICSAHQHINKSNPGTVGVHLAYVEVDTYTGMTQILDYLAVCDIGKAINREMCVAQVQGAVVMGAGAALTEHIHLNDRGEATRSIKDYHVINSFEAPKIRVDLVEDEGTDGPFGAKSIGEVCYVPVSAAVAGAVNDALDSSIGDLPLNADVIAKYLMSKSK